MHSDSWYLGYDDSDSVGGGGANGPENQQREPLQAGPAFRPVSRSPAHLPDYSSNLQQQHSPISRQNSAHFTFDQPPSQLSAPQLTSPVVAPRASDYIHPLLDYNPCYPYENPAHASQESSLNPTGRQFSLPDFDPSLDTASVAHSRPQEGALVTDEELPLPAVTRTKSHRREFNPVISRSDIADGGLLLPLRLYYGCSPIRRPNKRSQASPINSRIQGSSRFLQADEGDRS
jgi:hypothetical protein